MIPSVRDLSSVNENCRSKKRKRNRKAKQTSGLVSKYQTAQHARLSVSVEVEAAFIDEKKKTNERASQSVLLSYLPKQTCSL
jgi:hypothetical protein